MPQDGEKSFVKIDRPNGPVISEDALRYPNGDLPEHGDEVICWLKRELKHDRHGRLLFKYWRVKWIEQTEDYSNYSAGDREEIQGRYTENSYKLARGYVCITNQNIKNKHDERVFFVPIGSDNASAQQLCFTKEEIIRADWFNSWNYLIEDYQATHEQDLHARGKHQKAFDAFLDSSPGKTAWSRHVYEGSSAKLEPGDLCYARANEAGSDIVGLYPVMISRELSRQVPRELLPEPLQPAQKMKEFSAADRVFGWVRQGKDDGQDARTESAYKGHFRVRKITCTTSAKDAVHKFNGGGLPLAILSAPKPQQALFYADGERDYDKKEDTNLRGRKFYPHHRREPESIYWDARDSENEASNSNGRPTELNSGDFREYIRHRDRGRDANTKQRDSQNRSVKAWVKPDTIFKADLRFDNLNAAELGALLWLCNLGEGRHLKVGAGKPLGFGSVSPRITCVEIRDYAAKQAEYKTLVPAPVVDWESPGTNEATTSNRGAGGRLITCPASAVDKFVPEFENALGREDGQLESHPVIRAFLWMAEGPEDGAPIHYPRIRRHGHSGPVPPDPKGENYRWFDSNQRAKKCPLPAPGKKGLPYY